MKNNRFQKHTIYKKDKWNMLNVEIQGNKIVVREISDQWGEDTRTFLSRPALMEWAESRFRPEDFPHDPEERERILEALRRI